MAIVKIIKTDNIGWRKDDHVELFGKDLENYVSKGWVEVITPDPKLVVTEPELYVKKSERKGGDK